MKKKINHPFMSQSRLQIAISTDIDKLTDEQKQLINDCRDALSDAEVARFAEAGILQDKERDPQQQDLN